MAFQLLRLRGVLDDEAEELRELLSANGIDYYETPRGNWGVSAPAIWLRDDGQVEQAKRLLEAYQRERALHARREYERLKAQGKESTFLDGLKADPVRVVAYLAIVVVIVYFSIMPFVKLGG